MRRLESPASALLACAVAALAACESPTTKAPPTPPGELIGRVEISEDVPATGCRAILEGTPLGAQCDETGEFDIKRVPPGRWNLRVFTDSADNALPARRIAAGANPSTVTDLGPVRLAKPGSIGGHLKSIAGHDLGQAILTVAEIGAVTAPNDNGGYLLEGVSPGVHDVVLLLADGQVIHANVTVLPSKVTTGVDFDLSTAAPSMLQLRGVAKRADPAAPDQAGITVDLVESLDGKVITSAKTDKNGAFTLPAQQGTYILRAHDGANPTFAIVPSVVVHGTEDVELIATLNIPAPAGDLDGDGLPDATDPDIDGDGVPNEMDAFPRDPAESKDTDGDGVGDHADLRSMGGATIDRHTPTPDTDGDGKLDFEDNCPTKPNPGQEDADGDGVGDACDNCPFVSNADQQDSVGNGTGDACRFCRQNVDCGAGKICQFGQCVDCIADAQCGEKVCDVQKGRCVLCDTTHVCPGNTRCGPLGLCVACNVTADCPSGNACVQNACVPQCVDASNCMPKQFCNLGVCVYCRSTADCPSPQWCDTGVCRPQCTTNADCTGGRICDTNGTRTCILPCSGMCLNGQACVSGTCRSVCDGSRPCPAGQVCSAMGYCGPECITNGDCAGKPFTTCQSGTCVPSGACATDGDCPKTQMCFVDPMSGMGQCGARPTTANGMGNFPCSGACDCRAGEICGPTNVCIPDVVPMPTRYVAAASSGSGDGSSPANVAPTLAPLAAAVANDVVAIKKGDTINITTPVAISKSNVSLVGGYLACAINRWVRDDTASSTVVNTSTTGKGVFTIKGMASAPLDTVTLRNLTLTASDTSTTGYKIVDAAFAPHLTIAKMILNLPSAISGNGQTEYGVYCTSCNTVNWADVSMPSLSLPYNTYAVLVRLDVGSGTIARTHIGQVASTNFGLVGVTNATGALTVDASTADGFDTVGTTSATVDAVSVQNAFNGPVVISNSQIKFTSSAQGPSFIGVYAKSIGALTVNNNLIDGTGIAVASTNTTSEAFHLEDVSGTASMNQIVFPQSFSGGTLYAFNVIGPAGALTIANNTSTGGQAGTIYLVNIDTVTNGPPIVQSNNFAATFVNSTAWAVKVNNTNYSNLLSFSVADNTFRMPNKASATSPNIHELDLNNSIGRLERNKFIGGSSGTCDNTLGGSTIELYDNYIYCGVPSNIGYALDLSSSVKLTAIGNTIDPGGTPTTSDTFGIDCSSASALTFKSNLISGGQSNQHFMASGASCLQSGPAVYQNNYFWYGGAGAPPAGDAIAPSGVTAAFVTGNGNLVDVLPSNGCYDPLATADTFYQIAADTKCKDAGVTGTRKDGTAITTDITNVAASRTKGSAPDIGCFEKQ
jgi:hypothetical protein